MYVQHITLLEFPCRLHDIPTSTLQRPATATQRGQ